MKKKVLVVYYTQSGQLLEISKNVVSQLEASEEIDVDFFEIKLKKDFPFPWDKTSFMDAFPESFLEIPTDVANLDDPCLEKRYDLIILSYQVWYLSPSIPINSFLKTQKARKLFNNTPVLTVIGCRNMWVMAQEKLKRTLVDLGANLVGNIALVDKHLNHISVITIVKWLTSGKKERYLGIFPKPGVAQKDIDESIQFSPIIKDHVLNGDYNKLHENLLNKGAVTIKSFLVVMDKRANILFDKWAHFILSNKLKRSLKVKLFKWYLLIAIWIISPIVFLIFLLTCPFLFSKIRKENEYYLSVKTK